jgi:uncharacterized protein (DUF1499 family)
MKTTLYIILSLIALFMIAVQFGLLAGQRPTDLGVAQGRLKPPSTTRNSVSSQATLHPGHPQIDYANIAPLPLRGNDATASMRVLVAVLHAMPGLSVVEEKPDYVYAQAQTRWLKFVDDVEFWFNPAIGMIEVRSASRLGREDFGVNRQRVEAIRSTYLAQP